MAGRNRCNALQPLYKGHECVTTLLSTARETNLRFFSRELSFPSMESLQSGGAVLRDGLFDGKRVFTGEFNDQKSPGQGVFMWMSICLRSCVRQIVSAYALTKFMQVFTASYGALSISE